MNGGLKIFGRFPNVPSAVARAMSGQVRRRQGYVGQDDPSGCLSLSVARDLTRRREGE